MISSLAGVSSVLLYMIFLIRDLDDPFEYELNGSQAGAAEVSLTPIVRLEQQLGCEIDVVADDEPSSAKSPGLIGPVQQQSDQH